VTVVSNLVIIHLEHKTSEKYNDELGLKYAVEVNRKKFIEKWSSVHIFENYINKMKSQDLT
jgi:hypothetical protein